MADVSRFLAEVLEVASYAPYQTAKVRRREEPSGVDRPHYPVVGGRVTLGEWVWCLETDGSLVILGREFIPSTHIEGLILEWVSGTSLKVSAGSAYVPALDGVIETLNPITKSGLSLTANTWYYVYAFAGAGGALDIEVSSTPPAAPYRGAARTRAGDDTRRFLGSVRAGAEATLLKFERVGQGEQFIRYKENVDTTLRILSASANQNALDTSTAALQPPTSRALELWIRLERPGAGGSGRVFVSSTDDGLQTVGVQPAAGQLATAQVNDDTRDTTESGPVATGASQTIRHGRTGGANPLYSLSVLGYYEER